MFTPDQKSQLAAKLDGQHVKSRSQAGRSLSYLEGWFTIAEANRIFGFDAWDRETVWINCVWSGERSTGKGPKPAASYVARVRITVRAGDTVVVREGTGAGSGFGSDAGEAHESAIKEAETDAMKRALMTFGNPFGLALYDKAQENVMTAQEKAAAEQAISETVAGSITVAVEMCNTLEELESFAAKHNQQVYSLPVMLGEKAVAKILGKGIELSLTLDQLGNFWTSHSADIKGLSLDVKADILAAKDKRKAQLQQPVQQAAE